MFFKDAVLVGNQGTIVDLEKQHQLLPLVQINYQLFRLIRVSNVDNAIADTVDGVNQITVQCYRGDKDSVEVNRVFIEGEITITEEHPFFSEFYADLQQEHVTKRSFENTCFVASNAQGELHFLRIDPIHDGDRLVPHAAGIQLALGSDDYDFRIVHPRQKVTITHGKDTQEIEVIKLPGGETHNYIKRNPNMRPKERHLIALRHLETTRFNTPEDCEKVIKSIMGGRNRVECYHVVERLRNGGEDSVQGLAAIGMLSEVQFDETSNMIVGWYEPRKRYAYPLHRINSRDSVSIFAFFTEGATYNEGGQFKLTNFRVMMDIGSLDRYLVKETGNQFIRI